MLEFFRKYQKFFFFFVAVLVIGSFAFFGTFGTLAREEVKGDVVLGRTLDGASLKRSEVERLSRFLASDREDLLIAKQMPNLCNDGVIRNDLLKTGIADLLVSAYFEPLREELAERLAKAKRYLPYAHPHAPVSVRSVWKRVAPAIGKELDLLQAQEDVSAAAFTHLSRLYQAQSQCPPELLRRAILFQHRQFVQGPLDPRLQYEDFSLFGFSSLVDWFGRNFLDLASQFILNGARLAEQRGYAVSLEEAKGDLLKNFSDSIQNFPEKVDLTYSNHLRQLGWDESSAASVWRSVLLFRRYLHSVGDALFVDSLPSKDFASYAREKAIVQEYRWPSALKIKTFLDLAEFQVYLKAVSAEKNPLALPTQYLSLEEVESHFPQLVQTCYQVQHAAVPLAQVGLRASTQELLRWQLEGEGWSCLSRRFPLFPTSLFSKEERFAFLEKTERQTRGEIDRFSREEIARLHPEWIGEELAGMPLTSSLITASKNEISLEGVREFSTLERLLAEASEKDPAALQTLAQYSDDGKIYHRIVQVEKKEGRHLLTWEEAKHQGVAIRLAERFLEAQYPKVRGSDPEAFQSKEGGWRPFSQVKEEVARVVFADLLQKIGKDPARRLEAVTREAWQALQKNPDDFRWIKSGSDPLGEQFKMEKSSREVQRTDSKEWLVEQAFSLSSHQWSPLRFPSPDPSSCFFYLEEKKSEDVPFSDFIARSQEVLSADADRFLAEKLLEEIQKKHAIVIPSQKETE